MARLSLTCPSTGTSALTLADHENIDSLVHGLSEDTFTDIIRDGAGAVTNVDTLTAPAGTNVRTTEVFRNSNNVVTGTLDIQYDASGAEIQRLITTINRNSQGTVVSIETEEVP